MVCRHLSTLETELLATGITETFRGQTWSENCREWVYFDVVLDTHALQGRLHSDACIRVHENRDARSGTERGFECIACHDAIMGRLEGGRVFT